MTGTWGLGSKNLEWPNKNSKHIMGLRVLWRSYLGSPEEIKNSIFFSKEIKHSNCLKTDLKTALFTTKMVSKYVCMYVCISVMTIITFCVVNKTEQHLFCSIRPKKRIDWLNIIYRHNKLKQKLKVSQVSKVYVVFYMLPVLKMWGDGWIF